MKKDAGYVVAVGSSSLDTYYEAPYWPDLGDKVMVERRGVLVGGLVSNAACTMAACGIETFLVDTVNPDARDRILEEIERYGVRSDYVATGDESVESMTNIVLVRGEKTIFVSKNKPGLVMTEELSRLFARATGVYSVLPEIRKISGCLPFLRSLKSCGVKLFWDMEPATFSEEAEDMRLAEMADVLFFNEWGMKKFSGGPTEAAAYSLLGSGVEIVVVTMGEKGCRVFSKDGELRVGGIDVEAVDTTGAGDAFNSVFLFGYLHGWELDRTARMANAAGARAVTHLGPKSGAVSIEEVERFEARLK